MHAPHSTARWRLPTAASDGFLGRRPCCDLEPRTGLAESTAPFKIISKGAKTNGERGRKRAKRG